MAADWLCRIQEPDGNIPPIINPLAGSKGSNSQVDWPRLAFTAWSLAEFGKAIKEEKYLRAAEKGFEYLKKYLLGSPELGIRNQELTLAYFGQLSLSLGKSRDATIAAEKILVRFPGLSFEPITFSQIASFFKETVKCDHRFRGTLENILIELKNRFESAPKNKEPMDLAVWAELVNMFKDSNPEFSQKVLEWLKIKQLSSGAFPESTISEFVYTRGTGKIFEVLAINPVRNRDALNRVLRWLLSMQYHEESAFAVPHEFHPAILGGFRHDYFNQEAWIDAAGHILLGGSRLVTPVSENTMISHKH